MSYIQLEQNLKGKSNLEFEVTQKFLGGVLFKNSNKYKDGWWILMLRSVLKIPQLFQQRMCEHDILRLLQNYQSYTHITNTDV